MQFDDIKVLFTSDLALAVCVKHPRSVFLLDSAEVVSDCVWYIHGQDLKAQTRRVSSLGASDERLLFPQMMLDEA